MYALEVGREVVGTVPTIEFADAVARWLQVETGQPVAVREVRY